MPEAVASVEGMTDAQVVDLTIELGRSTFPTGLIERLSAVSNFLRCVELSLDFQHSNASTAAIKNRQREERARLMGAHRGDDTAKPPA